MAHPLIRQFNRFLHNTEEVVKSDAPSWGSGGALGTDDLMSNPFEVGDPERYSPGRVAYANRRLDRAIYQLNKHIINMLKKIPASDWARCALERGSVGEALNILMRADESAW